MTIRHYKTSDAVSVANLISATYRACNTKNEPKDAVAWYLEKFDVTKNLVDIQNMFAQGTVTLVAEENGKIVGFLWGKKQRIINLYVSVTEHGKGIGRRLVEKYEKKVASMGATQITIRSSIYAVPFYQAMGYKKSTGTRKFHGLIIQPMKKILK
jgi:predicted N-acetyltransferase YhbS